MVINLINNLNLFMTAAGVYTCETSFNVVHCDNRLLRIAEVLCNETAVWNWNGKSSSN